jgi:CheY-like chemotaxis protein
MTLRYSNCEACPDCKDGTRVAVLDDDEDVATSIAQSLVRAGYDSCAYTTGHAVLEAATSKPFDCLIADWCLRQCTSGSTLACLRRIEGYSSTPVIVLSGNVCFDGTPASAELRAAISDLNLLFRSKPRTTAKLVRDLQLLATHSPLEHR